MDSEHLQPVRYPQAELFLCDIGDAVIKDDMASMEHPIFVLSKKPVTEVRRYENGDNWLEVVPSVRGCATIWDKDLLIFVISQIMAAKKAGQPYGKYVRFYAVDFLRFSNRRNSGKEYELLRASLDRLDGTRIRTNIETGGTKNWEGFGLVQRVFIKQESLDGRVLEWGLEISDWLFRAIEANEVLTLHPDYFRLKKPMERRVYEIARKHCGRSQIWRVNIDLLQKKCGSNSPRKKFRYMIKTLCMAQHLPDYSVELIEDTVVFRPKADFKALDKRPPTRAAFDYERIPPLRTDTYDKFRKLHPYRDPHHTEEQWRIWAADKEPPKNPDAAFLAFSKKFAKNNPI